MKPTIERLQTQLAGLQAQLAYAQQDRDAALKASAAARERETATADILRIINESPADLERIMPEIARAAERFCGADHGVIGFEVKGADGQPTFHNWDRIRGLRVFEQGVSRFALTAADEIRGFTHVVGRIEDWEAEYPGLVGITRADGLTELALLSVPLMSGKSRIGYMLARRNTARAFDAHHITLLQHLAAQAVVAVENARAFNELQARNREVAQALEQQTTTAEILDVISRSPSNLQAALDAVVLNATRLLESEGAVVIRFMADGTAGWVAMANGGEIAPGPRLATPAPTPADAGSEAMAILLGSRTVMRHGGPDSIAADAPNLAAMWRARRVNASIVTPLQTTRGRFGALVVTRASPEPYTDAQIRLLETFASQAVIAIENAGLFSELQTRNQEVTAALNEQTAMAEVLGIIAASPESLEKPLQAIVESAARLCEGTVANLWLLDGTDAYIAAQHKPANLAAASDVPIGRRVPIGAVALFSALRDGRSRRVDSWNDIDAEDYPRDPSQRVPAHVDRSAVYVPLHVRDEYIGMIAIFRETVRPFSDHNVELVSTFAQQAVIAIENARLLRELRESNREVHETLEIQTVMAKVLGIVASAPTDLDATLPQIAAAAEQLCGSRITAVGFQDGDSYRHWDTRIGFSRQGVNQRGTFVGTAIAENRVVDVCGRVEEWGEDYPVVAMWTREEGEFAAAGVAVMVVPLQGPAGAVGAIMVMRLEAEPFTERHLRILQTLADQAVVAIGNARLFNELQERNQQITEALRREEAGSEILRQISNTPEELDATLQAVTDAARRLTGCSAALWSLDGRGRDHAGTLAQPGGADSRPGW